jgi:dTDP-4-dehydrorhamnose reductase
MSSAKNFSQKITRSGELEVWGGLECTVARIGDIVRNQIEETGHFHRASDLYRIAGLGIRTLRYPVLWESISPDHPDQENWAVA